MTRRRTGAYLRPYLEAALRLFLDPDTSLDGMLVQLGVTPALFHSFIHLGKCALWELSVLLNNTIQWRLLGFEPGLLEPAPCSALSSWKFMTQITTDSSLIRLTCTPHTLFCKSLEQLERDKKKLIVTINKGLPNSPTWNIFRRNIVFKCHSQDLPKLLQNLKRFFFNLI